MNKFNWLIKGLRFSNVGWDLLQEERRQLKNKQKLELWLRSWTLTPSYNLDLKPLSPCKGEPLKKLKSCRLQMFFKIGSIKNFAIFTGKHLCWGLFLVQLLVYRSATFLKISSNTGVSCGYCKSFKNSFLVQHLRWLLLTVLPPYSTVGWGAFFDFAPPHAFDLDKNLHETLHK